MDKKIVDILQYAYKNVPFYKNLYTDIDINIDSVIGFSNLPIVTKEDILEHFDLMISSEFDITNLIQSFTSGTTGLQLNVYNTKMEQMRRAMLLWNEREKNFPNIMRRKKAMFNDATWMGDKYAHIIDDMIYLNTIYLCKDSFEKYYCALNEFQPEFIHGSTSALYEFTCYLKKTSKKLNYDIKYIELAGEYVPSGVYDELKEFFKNTLIINYYGSIEFFSIAHGCKNNNLHETEESVFVEVINQNEEGYGDLIITSMINKAMPLIRYSLGDIGRIRDNTCTCGKSGRIIELQSGRKYDYFIDGERKITAGIFQKILLEYFQQINDEKALIHFNVKQEAKDILQFTLVLRNKINVEHITNFLSQKINKYLNHPVKVYVNTQLDIIGLKKSSKKFKMYDFFKNI